MKRFVGILLAACMTLGTLPAFAAESDSAQMQEALAYVKTKVEVPDELNKFSGSVSEDEKGEDAQYSFVWRGEDNEKSIRVMTDKDSKIMEYRFFDDEEYDNAKFNKVTVEAAKEAADSFLEKIVPEKAEKLRFVSSDDNGSYYRYQYIHEENGYPVKDENVVVTVRIRGQQDAVVTDMSVSEWTMDGFEVSEADIGLDKAKEIYKNKGGHELVYRRSYADEKMYLVYAAKDDVKYFDAETGNEVEYNKYFGLYRDGAVNSSSAKASLAGGASAADEAAEFSREEIEELERVEGMLSVDEIVEKLRAMPEIEVPDGEVLSKNIYKTYHKDKDSKQYTMSLRIGTKEKSASASVDAMDGELLSFYNYSSDMYKNSLNEESKKAYTEEQKAEAENTIDGFVKAYAPTYYAQVRENEDYYYDRHLSKNYTRVLEGIPYYSNGITVSYDMETCKITSFSVNFDLMTNMVSKSEIKFDLNGAYDKVFENAGLIKEYIVSGGEAPKLVYTLEKPDYMTIDAVTGKSVGWNGREVREKITDYSDISGHWAQEYIERLAKVGYSVDSDKFRPDEAITQKDFLWMITGGGAGDAERMYKDLISQKVIDEDEKNPDAPITKEQAVIYLMDWNGYKEVANLEGIYVTGFSDEQELNKIGYIALAKGFGIVTGDTDNRFHPEKQITRAEAAAMLYKLLDR
jgi:hypothetical protein